MQTPLEDRVVVKRSSRGSAALALGASAAMVVLVASAISDWSSPLFYAIITCASLPALALQRLFPERRLLWMAFVNLVAIYASVFALFVDEVFKAVREPILSIGFALPVVLFVSGCWQQRVRVAQSISGQSLRWGRGLRDGLIWLLPVGLVGFGVIALGQVAAPIATGESTFIAAMALIGAIVLAVSRDVAIFLVEIGLLFEEFVRRMAHLLVPALAFLTFYSLIVVVFAALYAIASKAGLQDHFRVFHEARALTFPEAFHFSVVTMSTVGYGDIVPASSVARSLAAIEVVAGTMLLLFGVSEILEYSRERRIRNRD